MRNDPGQLFEDGGTEENVSFFARSMSLREQDVRRGVWIHSPAQNRHAALKTDISYSSRD